MLSVKQYLGGMRIYQDVYSIYGPVYYFYNSLLHVLTSSPVTHDVTRLSSLVPWLGCALFCAWATLRLTGSLVVASMAHVFVAAKMVFFRAEPGHPQELLILLLVAFAVLPVFTSHRAVLMIGLGSLGAAITL